MQYFGKSRRIFAGWHNVRKLSILPAGHSKVYKTVPDCWLKEDASYSLYVPIKPMLALSSGLYMASVKECAALILISKAENILKSYILFIAA